MPEVVLERQIDVVRLLRAEVRIARGTGAEQRRRGGRERQAGIELCELRAGDGTAYRKAQEQIVVELQTCVEARQQLEIVFVGLGGQVVERIVDLIRRGDELRVALHGRLRLNEAQAEVADQRQRSGRREEVHLAVERVADLAIIERLGRIGGRGRSRR